MGKEVEITIDKEGQVDIDQIGYKGIGCTGDVDVLINAIGKKKKVKRKAEFYDKQKVKINQSH